MSIGPSMINDKHRRALSLIAKSPVGIGEPLLVSRGYSVEQVANLVRAGLVYKRVGTREFVVRRLLVTAMGRQVLGTPASRRRPKPAP
jgi:hypothetical protein